MNAETSSEQFIFFHLPLLIKLIRRELPTTVALCQFNTFKRHEEITNVIDHRYDLPGRLQQEI
jgi:hypothetical protein